MTKSLVEQCRAEFERFALDNLPSNSDGIYYCSEETSPYEIWQAAWMAGKESI